MTLPVTDVYESIQRGMIEGYSSMILDTIPSLSLEEVAPVLTDIRLGIYTGNVFIMNSDTYNSLSDEQKELFAEVSRDYQDHYIDILNTIEDDACTIVLDAGGVINTWPQSETDKWKNAVGDTLLNQWKTDASARGADPDAFYDLFLEKVEAASADYQSGMSRCAAR